MFGAVQLVDREGGTPVTAGMGHVGHVPWRRQGGSHGRVNVLITAALHTRKGLSGDLAFYQIQRQKENTVHESMQRATDKLLLASIWC